MHKSVTFPTKHVQATAALEQGPWLRVYKLAATSTNMHGCLLISDFAKFSGFIGRDRVPVARNRREDFPFGEALRRLIQLTTFILSNFLVLRDWENMME